MTVQPTTIEATHVAELPQSWLDQIIEAIRRRPVPLVGNDGDVILSFREWYELAGLSERTAQELRAKGEGPRWIKLTDKKLGVTLAEHRRWIKQRMEAAA